jgi:hypothetical protein
MAQAESGLVLTWAASLDVSAADGSNRESETDSLGRPETISFDR